MGPLDTHYRCTPPLVILGRREGDCIQERLEMEFATDPRQAYRGKYKAVVESQRNRIAVGEGQRRGKWRERLQWQWQGADYGR